MRPAHPRTLALMSLLGPSYPVSRSTGVCASTGKAFTPGEEFIATLVERDGQRTLERLDFSVAAWDEGARPPAGSALFGFWRAAFAAPEAKKAPLLGDDEVQDLFEDLGAATDEKQVRFRFLLALLLIRRRRLRVVGSRPGALMVRATGTTGEPIEVLDPGMDESAIAEAVDQLAGVVNMDAAPEGKP